ncbi:hypothetical protein [Aliiroseovarius sediminilitoris]|nr:hypothetical protein [Aliiroseovarius sediminilitoris]
MTTAQLRFCTGTMSGRTDRLPGIVSQAVAPARHTGVDMPFAWSG